MQFDEKGKHLATPRVSEIFAASVATLGEALVAIVERMEAEVAEQGMISAASASELRQVRVRAERLFGASTDENV